MKVLKMLKFSRAPITHTLIYIIYLYLYLKHCASMVRGKISVVISEFPVKFIHAQYMRGERSELVYFWTLSV